MSLQVSGTGNVYPHVNGHQSNATSPKNETVKNEHAKLPVEALINLNCSPHPELGLVTRSGNVERFTPLELHDAQGAETKSIGGLNLPCTGSRAVVVDQMPEGIIKNPGITYREVVDQGKSTGIFIRNGCTVGRFANGPATTMVSGSCLFGSAGLVGKYADGSEVSLSEPGVQLQGPLVGVRIDAGFSLYEVEGLERQAAIVREMHRLNPELSRLCFQIPCEEYMLYCLGAKLAGLINPDLYQQICVAIEHRMQSQARYLQELIPPGLKLEILRPLAPVYELVQAGKFADEESACKAIYGALCEANAEHAALFKALKKVKALPHISLRGYSLGYVLSMASDPHGAIVAIETFSEDKIALALTERDPQKYLQAQNLSLETIYSLEGLVPVSGTMQLVRNVGGTSGLGSMGIPMPSLNVETTVPRIGYLFFSGLQANEALTQEVHSRFSSIGRKA